MLYERYIIMLKSQEASYIHVEVFKYHIVSHTNAMHDK